ncbi:MAG: type II secretion system F family protein, partial [Candidatus Nanohaloarchaea archaeon]
MGSLLVGGSIIGANFIHYSSSQERYSITYQEAPERLTFSRNDPAQITFKLQNPQKLKNLRLNIVFRDVSPQTGISLRFNTRTTESLSGMSPGSSHTMLLESDQLRRTNTLQISGQFGFASRAEIASVTASGVTGFQRILFLVLNILGLIIIVGPILIRKYLQYSRQQELEEEFPNFLRDVVEGVRAGMPLPQAIQNTSSNNYGQLTPYVEDMSAKLEWGIPFEKAVLEFGRKTGSQI